MTIQSQSIDSLLGHSLIAGETIAEEMRSVIVRESIKARRQLLPNHRVLESIRNVVADLTPILAESFWSSDLSAWLTAYEWNAKKLPDWLNQYLVESSGVGRVPPGRIIGSLFEEDVPKKIIFKQLKNAAKSLMDRGILDREDFDRVNRDAKARSFTIAGELETDTIETVRDVLSELVDEGGSLKMFRDQVADRIGSSRIGPAHLENIYRTNMQSAIRDGRESLLQNPIVSSIFPYQEYVATHDGRVRKDHLALETLGLSGTGIYRRDDPFWEHWTPPCGYNCRCTTILITLESAAKKGVLEAQRWIDTGRPPSEPEFRLSSIPFSQAEGFGQRRGELVA